MSEANLIRPSQVTMAGWMVIVGSIVVVLTVFEQMTTFTTVEVREEVAKFLAEPPGEGLGISVDSALTLLRVLSMVAAGCATAAGVLGWHVLRRHRPSRIALSVVAVPLFFSGIVAGGFFSSLVAASALMLWSRPARDWFDGVNRPKPEIVHPSGARNPAKEFDYPPPVITAPPPYAGFGAPTVPAARYADRLRARPDQVLWACVLTWAFSALSVVVLGASAVALLIDGSSLIAEARAQNSDLDATGMTDNVLLVSVAVFLATLIVWALLVIIVTFFVWRGREWARIAVLVSAGLSTGLAVVAAIASSFLTVPLLIASAVVMRMLLSRQAAAWCRAPRASHPGANAPG